MPPIFGKASTFLIPSGPYHDPTRLHLHVVCTDACKDNKYLIVSVSTKYNDKCDQTCVLQPHEHAWLKHESFVFYRNASIIDAETIRKGLAVQVFVQKGDLNGQTLLRITNGICRSPQTPRKIKTYAGCS